MDEVFDTFDEQMNWTGTATRNEVHRLGLWHRTFHCWVMIQRADGDYLVLQRRHSSKDTHPDKLDTSCAGHLDAGESPRDGVRELREELGINVDFQQLHPVGIYRYSDESSGVRDNEFCHVFILVQQETALADYSPAVGELSGLYLARVTDMQELCRRNVNRISVTGFAMDNEGRKYDSTRAITLHDMAKYDIGYYEMLFEGLGTLSKNGEGSVGGVE